MAKYPETFFPIVKEYLEEDELYESFILNFFHGLSLPILDVVCAVIMKMWNVIINIVTSRGVFKKFHNQDD